MITGSVQITDMSANEALRKYAGIQKLMGRTMAQTMRNVMRFWVSFATAKIKPGNREKLMQLMTSIVSNYSRVSAGATGTYSTLRGRKVKRNKRVDQWRGTYAAMLVAALNYKKARNMGYDQFYQTVGLFVRRRGYALNLHKSGMRPAIMRLRAKMTEGGRLPKFKNAPGGYTEKVKEKVIDILVENWAKAHGDKSIGVAGKDPAAFEQALPEVFKLIEEFTAKDIKQWAEENGLTAD